VAFDLATRIEPLLPAMDLQALEPLDVGDGFVAPIMQQ
jgi:hypothetical protein